MSVPKVVMPAEQIPSFRTMMALKNKVADNLMFTTWGGLGDQICAEPTLRFALETFKGAKVSLYTEIPEMFAHLSFHAVYTPKDKPDFSKFLVLNTITNPETLTWEFVSHCVTHCVDFPSICALRCTLPIDLKAVELPVEISPDRAEELSQYTDKKYVAIHAGKHWESKTFPVEWWNEVIETLVLNGKIPVLFGKEINEEQGTVQTTTKGCVDLRNKLPLVESVWLLQRMNCLVSNDSSPMHMAVSGKAHIAFVASAKHQDYLYHWRRNDEGKVEWAWRMKHFNLGGLWETIDYCPNKESTVLVDKCDPELLKAWLPHPSEIVSWVVSR
jgi:hypothetical protein